MKFRAPKGGLALHPAATVIEHMVLQPVRPERPVLICDAGECMNDGGGWDSSYGKSGKHKQGYVITGLFEGPAWFLIDQYQYTNIYISGT